MAQLEMLITVKTYPVLTGQGERACVAGLQRRVDGSLAWVRIFPVPFRELEETAKFQLWQWITVNAKRFPQDKRPETWLPLSDSIELGKKLDTDRATWQRRMDLLEPLLLNSMCEVLARQGRDGTSLGAFRVDPASVEVYAEENAEWSAKTQARAQQGSLLHPELRPLEWIPWRFKVRYRCDRDCPVHDQGAYDWGLMELYRKQRKSKSDVDAMEDAVARLQSIFDAANEPVLMVGNQHQGPRSFMVIAWAHPKRRPSGLERHGEQLGLEGL